MANNPYINKVVYNNNTLIDITDTTAVESDVAQGVVFYKADGTRSVGTMTKDLPEFTIKGTITPTVSGGSVTSSDLKYALTSDRTIGMIWGFMLVKGAGSGTPVTVTTGLQVSPPSSAINIKGIMHPQYNLNTDALAQGIYLAVDTSGNVTLHYMITTNNTYIGIPPVILRFSDFE